MGCVECNRRVRREESYCEACLDRFFETTFERLGNVVREAGDIYLGRSGNPERRLFEHFADSSRDHLAILHWSDNKDAIAELERELISEFEHRWKQTNVHRESVGRWPRTGWSCVYLSWRWKASAAPPKGLRPRTLREFDYEGPEDPSWNFCDPPTILTARISREEARGLVADYRAQFRP